MSTTTEPILITLSEVQPEQVRWLWPNRVPLGKVTIFFGDPGLGKSFAALHLAALVSRGDQDVTSAGDVILLSAEDDPADTIRPRLDTAGADASRVHILKAVQESANGQTKERMLRLDRDIEQIREALRRHPETKLVIIDPLSAYMGNVDSRSDEQVRSMLTPLFQLALESGVAIICIKHLNKAEEKSAMYRAGGSIAFIAAVRMAWMFVKDRNDPERRLMVLLKSNIEKNPGAFAFSIQETESGPRVVWESGTVEADLDDVLQPAGAHRGTVRENTEKWLRELLANGPLLSKEVDEAANAAGLTHATLRRAKTALKVKATREGYASNGQWKLSLP